MSNSFSPVVRVDHAACFSLSCAHEFQIPDQRTSLVVEKPLIRLSEEERQIQSPMSIAGICEPFEFVAIGLG